MYQGSKHVHVFFFYSQMLYFCCCWPVMAIDTMKETCPKNLIWIKNGRKMCKNTFNAC